MALVETCVLFSNGPVPKRNLRVRPSTFDALLRTIEGDPVFIATGPLDQFPVESQLAITLFHLGHFGNAASVESVAQWAGCSAGAVVVSTRHVIQAVMACHDLAIHRPNAEEKECAKQWVEAVSCPAWRDGYCMVDGTLVLLSDKPSLCGEGYYDRKSNYSLSVTVVNMPDCHIIGYVAGHCGSAHDSTVFAESSLASNPEVWFAPNEFVWADSAYAL
ncbi:hypothetical protein BS47DRAFT_1367345 [Hydnum rufescens UP504]|uniref:DDE Tnp4 domain-containing protein n=1 Tax=Hydnum rufescens UP504 TaxID=1448309 RepID=A0A9P6AIJ8_9AGAM|nr:hypothetical protein BS47DRAFT_1367345 [Hydnum rufescens UP504]